MKAASARARQRRPGTRRPSPERRCSCPHPGGAVQPGWSRRGWGLSGAAGGGGAPAGAGMAAPAGQPPGVGGSARRAGTRSGRCSCAARRRPTGQGVVDGGVQPRRTLLRSSPRSWLSSLVRVRYDDRLVACSLPQHHPAVETIVPSLLVQLDDVLFLDRCRASLDLRLAPSTNRPPGADHARGLAAGAAWPGDLRAYEAGSAAIEVHPAGATARDTRRRAARDLVGVVARDSSPSRCCGGSWSDVPDGVSVWMVTNACIIDGEVRGRWTTLRRPRPHLDRVAVGVVDLGRRSGCGSGGDRDRGVNGLPTAGRSRMCAVAAEQLLRVLPGDTGSGRPARGSWRERPDAQQDQCRGGA